MRCGSLIAGFRDYGEDQVKKAMRHANLLNIRVSEAEWKEAWAAERARREPSRLDERADAIRSQPGCEAEEAATVHAEEDVRRESTQKDSHWFDMNSIGGSRPCETCEAPFQKFTSLFDLFADPDPPQPVSNERVDRDSRRVSFNDTRREMV